MSIEGMQVYVICASDAYSYVGSYTPIAVFANEHEDKSKRTGEPVECCVFSAGWMG